jgi:hypothetical protein
MSIINASGFFRLQNQLFSFLPPEWDRGSSIYPKPILRYMANNHHQNRRHPPPLQRQRQQRHISRLTLIRQQNRPLDSGAKLLSRPQLRLNRFRSRSNRFLLDLDLRLLQLVSGLRLPQLVSGLRLPQLVSGLRQLLQLLNQLNLFRLRQLQLQPRPLRSQHLKRFERS